jgi:hypothetical protein
MITNKNVYDPAYDETPDHWKNDEELEKKRKVELQVIRQQRKAQKPSKKPKEPKVDKDQKDFGYDEWMEEKCNDDLPEQSELNHHNSTDPDTGENQTGCDEMIKKRGSEICENDENKIKKPKNSGQTVDEEVPENGKKAIECVKDSLFYEQYSALGKEPMEIRLWHGTSTSMTFLIFKDGEIGTNYVSGSMSFIAYDKARHEALIQRGMPTEQAKHRLKIEPTRKYAKRQRTMVFNKMQNVENIIISTSEHSLNEDVICTVSEHFDYTLQSIQAHLEDLSVAELKKVIQFILKECVNGLSELYHAGIGNKANNFSFIEYIK